MNADEIVGLNHIELLAGLDDDTLRALEKRCRWARYAGGEVILDRESENRDLFLVVSGVVRVVNFSTSGREIAFANVRAGSYFGELSAIDGEARSASVVAVEDCRLAALVPDAFRRLWQDNAEIADRIMVRLASIVRTCDERIMDLSTVRAVNRVYAELLRLAEPDVVAPQNRVIRPMRTHSDIASRISTTRETVARVLGQLATDGIVERKAKTLYIRDYERLAKLAERGEDLENEPAR
jgi:CRP-like cAMP-binding protein